MFLGKYSKWNLKFQNWSKSLCLGVSEPTKRLAAQSTAYMDDFFPTNDFSLLESCQLYLIAKYKASNFCKIEAVIQRCSVKKEFLKILQNSLENFCGRVSFLIKLQLKKRFWHRCFPVNISKFLRTSFFIEHLQWLPLIKLELSLWN